MSKIEADGLRQISVTELKKLGFLSNGRNSGIIKLKSISARRNGKADIEVSTRIGNMHLHMRYTEADDQNVYDYMIQLTTTPCGSGGGVRYWFICPTWQCQQRVGTLYLGDDGFACRHCYDLTYASRNVSKKYRDMFKIDYDTIEERVRREMATQ
jgi:hypothetical protein